MRAPGGGLFEKHQKQNNNKKHVLVVVKLLKTFDMPFTLCVPAHPKPIGLIGWYQKYGFNPNSRCNAQCALQIIASGSHLLGTGRGVGGDGDRKTAC